MSSRQTRLRGRLSNETRDNFEMTDLVTEHNGGQVICATSFDALHPPELVIDGSDHTFWSSTGMFPQEFIVKLGSTAQVTRIKTLTTNVKSMVVERCEGVAPISWEKVFDMECPDTDGRLQVESSQVSKITANFLKFKFVSGWDEFVTVHRVQVEGKTR